MANKFHVLIPFFILASISLATLNVNIVQAAGTYYVSVANGNDAWSGLLAAPNGTNTDGPFKTLNKVKLAMRSSTVKIATLRAGTYSLVGTNLLFDAADTGETWIPYQNEAAIIDGGGAGYISNSQGNNFTIAGLVFQNLGTAPDGDGLYLNGSGLTISWNKFLNCHISCLSGAAVTNSIIDSNIMDGQSLGNSSGSSAFFAIYLWGGSSNNHVTHNLIQNAEGGGIAIVAGVPDPAINNNIIDRNIFRNVDTNVTDSGALYLMDRTHTSVGNQITNNIIDGNGGANFLNNQTKTIYLDDLMSNVLVSGNICRNCGSYGIQYHAGDHNTIINNIFDISGGTLPAFYQSDVTNYGMSGNVFRQNIIYFPNTVPDPLWQYSVGTTTVAKPTDTTNLYYAASGASIPNTGQIIDANPIYANPQFANASIGNYAMPPQSPAYSQIGWQTLPTDQGPLPNPYLSPAPLPGDLNVDHIVNAIDWSIMNSKWFTNDANADLNHDGVVNAIDYSLLNANWFKTW